MASASYSLFDDTFEIKQLNPFKKRFQRVDRLVARSSLYDMELILDINSEIYKIKVGEQIALVLTSTPYQDGQPDPKEYQHDMGPSLLDHYEYVTYGKVFKLESVPSTHGREARIAVYISYGGLLMKLTGEQRHLAQISADTSVYCLIRKTRG